MTSAGELNFQNSVLISASSEKGFLVLTAPLLLSLSCAYSGSGLQRRQPWAEADETLGLQEELRWASQ